MGANGKRAVVSADWLYSVLWCLNRDQMPFETQVQTLWPAPQDSLQQLEMPTNSFFFFQTCPDIFGREMCPTLPSHPHVSTEMQHEIPGIHLSFWTVLHKRSQWKRMYACLLGGAFVHVSPGMFCSGNTFVQKKRVRLSQKDVSVRWRLDQR